MKTMLVYSAVYTLVVFFVSARAEPKTKNCNEVRAAYSSKGFNVNDVPNKGVQGEFELSLLGLFPAAYNVAYTQSFPKCWLETPGGPFGGL